MILVQLADDDLDKNGQFVRIGKVAAAIARASGANNLLNTERKVSAAINAGVQTKALNPIDPETLTPLSRNDWGNGIVTFDELAKWGQAGGLFRFWRASDGRPRTLTKAPPPISPTRGSGQTRLRTTVAAPDWTFWPASRPVREWQGIALSLNFEPWANEPSNFFSHYFPDANTEATFNKRQAMFLDFFPSNERMMLSEFAEWAVSVAKWDSLPPELVALVQTSDKKVPAPTSQIVGAGETASESKHAAAASDVDNRKTEIRRKRLALIKEVQSDWPTIENDLRHSNENGLSAAKLSEHGYWNLVVALNWARENGKVRAAKVTNKLPDVSAWSLGIANVKK